jgi:hypothetical protein
MPNVTRRGGSVGKTIPETPDMQPIAAANPHTAAPQLLGDFLNRNALKSAT